MKIEIITVEFNALNRSNLTFDTFSGQILNQLLNNLIFYRRLIHGIGSQKF